MTSDAPKLAVLVKGWPRLSETFIAQELVALQDAGHRFDIWSLRHPTDAKRHPLHDRFKGQVRYLPEYLYQEPARVARTRDTARDLPGMTGPIKSGGKTCAVIRRATAFGGLDKRAFWRRSCLRQQPDFTPISCTHHPRSRGTPPSCAACPGPLPPCQGYLDIT